MRGGGEIIEVDIAKKYIAEIQKTQREKHSPKLIFSEIFQGKSL